MGQTLTEPDIAIAEPRRRGRALVALAAVVGLVAVGAMVFALAQRASGSGDPNARPVDDVFGRQLATDAIWPDEPLSVVDLLDSLAAGILHWDSVAWDVSPIDRPEVTATGTDPAHPGRRVALHLLADTGGWRIVSTHPAPRLLLVDGDLGGLAGIRFPDDTVAVELFHHDGEQTTRTDYRDPLEWADTLVFPEPVPPLRAGTVLVVGRDATGQATLVSGRVIGSPERLTVATDSIMAAGAPAELPPIIARAVATDPTMASMAGEARQVPEIGPGLDLYVIPFTDRSGACFWTHDTTTQVAGSACAEASAFNASGLITFGRTDGDDAGVTLAVMPDSITIDPGIGGTIDASGHIVVLPGDQVDRLRIVASTLLLAP